MTLEDRVQFIGGWRRAVRLDRAAGRRTGGRQVSRHVIATARAAGRHVVIIDFVVRSTQQSHQQHGRLRALGRRRVGPVYRVRQEDLAAVEQLVSVTAAVTGGAGAIMRAAAAAAASRRDLAATAARVDGCRHHLVVVVAQQQVLQADVRQHRNGRRRRRCRGRVIRETVRRLPSANTATAAAFQSPEVLHQWHLSSTIPGQHR